MKLKIIEATDMSLYGKFLVGTFDEEWSRKAAIFETMDGAYQPHVSLLLHEGWGPDLFLLMDLSGQGNGALFSHRANGSARADVEEHGLPV